MFTFVLYFVFIIFKAEANDPATGAVILIANNQTLTFETTDLSGEAYYTYKDGEDFPINVLCKKGKDSHNQDTLRLEYYNAEGILLFRTKPRDQQPHIFRSVLKSNNDNYYLDCIRAARNPKREYRYRTMFFKRDLQADTVQHALILSVNGQKITTSLSKEKSYDDYIFRYIDGEILTVTCRKMDVNMGGSLNFHAEKKMSQTLRTDRPSEAVISLNLSTSDINNKSIICGINNTNVEKPNARLLFLSDVPANDVRIRGLPRSNILYQYTNELDQWTVEYQYFVNDTLNLTCVFNEGFHVRPNSYASSFQWKFEDTTVVSAAIQTPCTPVKFSDLPFTKILDATHNGTKIKCIYFRNYSNINEIVDIILRLKPKLVSEKNETVSGETPTNSYTLVYCATVAGVSVIIILTIIYLTAKKPYCCIRLSSQQVPPIPMPRLHLVGAYYENLLPSLQSINERDAAELENPYRDTGDDESSETPTNSYTLVYCATVAGFSVIIILTILYLTAKKPYCCIKLSSQQFLTTPIPKLHLVGAYYENLLPSLQPINERDVAELEYPYGETDDAESNDNDE